MSRTATPAAAAAACLLAACASYEALPPPPGLLELEGIVAEEPEQRGWIGLEVEANESDSLEDLEIRPGVRITAVAPGSPAEAAGLRPGDVLLTFAGVRTDDPGRLESLLRGIHQSTEALLRIERGTAVYELPLTVETRSPLGRARLLYHVDRARVRAAFRDSEEEGAFPVIARLAARSPLAEAGAREGDRVVSFQGRDPGSAAELVRRLRLELRPGEEARMRLRGPDGEEREVRFRAWSPERRLVSFSAWPLWTWRRDDQEQRESLVVGDLLLLSLFRRERIGHETDYAVLSLIRWRTGEALLESSLPEAEEGG
ncbi:MAG: PDZ domain-containing protein [Planctomycetota bacterium]|nr:MAG: PDZ domain-containing protein [Planctomycetota bacterium]